MRNQPIQPKKDTRDFSVFKPTHQEPVVKPTKVTPAPTPKATSETSASKA